MRTQIILSNPTGGAKFAKDVDGGPKRALARVTIESDEERRELVDSLVDVLDLNVDR